MVTLPRETIERLLERWPVARLATWDGRSRPHLVPIVFAPASGRLWSPIDGKPKRTGELARVLHIRRHPQVSLLLDRYDPDWQRLWWLRIDGRAEIVEPEEASASGEFDAAAEALRRKYPQYATVPLFRDAPRLIAIDAEATRSWCAGPDAAAAVLA